MKTKPVYCNASSVAAPNESHLGNRLHSETSLVAVDTVIYTYLVLEQLQSIAGRPIPSKIPRIDLSLRKAISIVSEAIIAVFVVEILPPRIDECRKVV